MKLLYLVLSVVLLSSVLSNTYLDKSFILEKFMDQPKELFKAFYTLYGKDAEYDINSELGIQKYKIFKSKVAIIKEENKKRGRKVYGITKFTDLTDEEFSRKYLMKPETLRDMGVNTNLNITPVVIDDKDFNWPSVDWRSYMNPVRHQLDCGSCWAFSSTATVEGNYNIQFNQLLTLSEQYLVDCDEVDNGCDGGWPTSTFTWMGSNGVVDAEEIKYRANKGSCSSFKKRNAKNLVSGFDYCDGNCTLQKWTELLSVGPMVVAMDGLAKNLNIYKPESIDVWYDSLDNDVEPKVDSCKVLNHAVTAVGIRKTADGTPLLVIRNSWGVDWGFEGHFTLPIFRHCFVLEHGWRPNVKEHSNFVPGEEFSKFYTSCDSAAVANSFEFGVADSKKQFGDVIRGIAFGSKYKNLFTYAEPNCTGKSQYVYPASATSKTDNRCFPNNKLWSKKEFQSAYVQSTTGNGCVWFYDQPCYSGNWARLCGNETDLSNLNFDFSKVQSIRMGGLEDNKCNIKTLFFFEETGYRGKVYGLPYAREFYLNAEKTNAVLPFFQNAKSLYFHYTPGC